MIRRPLSLLALSLGALLSTLIPPVPPTGTVGTTTSIPEAIPEIA